MNKKLPGALFALVLTVVLFAAFSLFALAVPSPDGAGACRSHPGALVTLERVPARERAPRCVPDLGGTPREIPLLTVVIGFPGLPYDDGVDWSEAIFTGEKSLAAYYTDMSFGQFAFTPAKESAAFGVGDNTNEKDRVNDGVVHVSVEAPHKDWAGEDEYPSLARALTEAIERADAAVDFASFDLNGNGFIENNELALGFVVAGYEGAASQEYEMGLDKYLWSHAWDISSIAYFYPEEGLSVPTPDGVAVSAYIAIAERLDEDTIEPISVLAHELGHYLGLPDLYDTTDNRYAEWGGFEVGNCSVMAGGSWGYDPDTGGNIPYSMDVWSRCALGWCTPETVSAPGDYEAEAQSYAENEAFSALFVPTAHEGEYYLIENRQFTKWDAGMAYFHDAGGLILWHVDDAVFEQYRENNQVNDTFHRPAVMPLYPEKASDGSYTFLGKNSSVLTNQPFFSASVWAETFGEGVLLDLPLYGEGANADKRAGRTLSGIRLLFPDDAGRTMRVRLVGEHAHALSAVAETPPTCVDSGVAAHWSCNVCGALFADESGAVPVTAEALTLPATGSHSYGGWSETTAPTCTTPGTEERVCAVCGASETREIPALGHDLLDHPGQAPTCSAIGWEAYQTCARCDYSTYKELPADPKAHVFNVTVYPPTCLDDGYTSHACRYCRYGYSTDVVPALGHDLLDHPAQAPTCSAIGWEAYQTCARCDYTTYQELPVDPEAHEFGEWSAMDRTMHARYCKWDPTHWEFGYHFWGSMTETKAPTCVSKGLMTYICAGCGFHYMEDTPELGHAPNPVPGKAATCTENGLTEGVVCERCGDTLTEQTVLPAAGHTFGEWTVSVPASVEAEGEETRVCAVCGAAETRPIPRIEKPAVTAENIGDVDGDGEVTAADARLALRAAVELEHFNEKTADIADADRDGAITAADARLILRAAVELEDRRTWLKKE